MSNTEETFRKNPTIGCRASSILSVALMLFLVDLLLSAIAITAGAGDNMRGQVGFVVKVYRDASPVDISEVETALNSLPGIREVDHTTADVVLKEERVFNPELLSLMGYNPFSDEFEVMVMPEYANADSIAVLSEKMAMLSSVEDVYIQPDLVDNINEILSRIKSYLSILVVLVMVISLSLIFNTIKLAIYSRRFRIYNMRIVGATKYFIIKPYLYSGLATGLISSVVAYVLFIFLVWYSSRYDYNIFFSVSILQYITIFLTSTALGILLCAGTSFYAVSKYINSSYDELFR